MALITLNMSTEDNYLAINRESWNNRVATHLNSEFYDLKGFMNGRNSLTGPELELLGDVEGKKILHLQCHFGQETISLARMGASTVGIDLSDKAIEAATALAKETGADAEFICSDVYNLPQHLHRKFDVVFTSYGTIGWLPDLKKWAKVISHFLKPGGQFVFVEFHPVVWMFDDQFDHLAYSYFKREAIVETESGTYADRSADIVHQSVSWNHSMSEVVNSLLDEGLLIERLNEYPYSPYNCFSHTEEEPKGQYQIAHLKDKLPMVYAIKAKKLV